MAGRQKCAPQTPLEQCGMDHLVRHPWLQGGTDPRFTCHDRPRSCVAPYTPPHTSRATSTHKRSFAHCCSSVSRLPCSVEANPHCGDSANCSSGRYFAAASIRRFSSSLVSSSPVFEVTSPSTTTLCPRGTKRSGSNPPARSLSYSMKYASALIWLNSTSATGS